MMEWIQARSKILWLLAAIVGGILLLSWYQGRQATLSEKPKRAGAALKLEARESFITGNVLAEYKALQTVLNKLADNLSGTKTDRIQIKCVKNNVPRIRECLDINYSVNYKRSGDITVGQSGDKMVIVIPAQAGGWAGAGGDLARFFQADRKNLDGAFRISVSSSLALNDKYCPVITFGDIGFSWDKNASIQIIGRNEIKIGPIKFGEFGPWNFEFGQYISGDTTNKLRDALTSATSAIPCEPIRNALTKAWRKYSFPVESQAGQKIFVNVDPTSLSIPPIRPDEKGVRVGFQVHAKVMVATEQGTNEHKGPLPPHRPTASPSGKVSLAVPVRASYAVLQKEARKSLVGKPYRIQTKTGEARFDIKGIEIFPSNDRVAVGVTVSVDLPSRIFDANGVVWLAAKPVVNSTTNVLSLSDVQLTRQLDNSLWNVLTAVFAEQIAKEITRATTYDFSGDAKKAGEALQKAVRDPSRTPGVVLDLKNPSLGIGRVQVESDAIAVEALLVGDWTAVIEDIRF